MRGFLSRTKQDIVVAKIFRATREATSSTRTVVVNVREQGLERVNVSAPDTTLRKIGKGAGVLLDLLTQVADGALKSPLRRADERANTNNFAWQVDQRVDTRTDKVNPSRETSVIDHLELLRERCQRSGSLAYVGLSNPMLVHKAHSMYQFAVV
jgi:hypothetical protein